MTSDEVDNDYDEEDVVNTPSEEDNVEIEDNENNIENEDYEDIVFDDDEDERKTIERLSGKLSQLLRKTSENQEQDNTDLIKFSFGMILSACIDSLDESGIEEIFDKFREKAEELKEEDDFVPEEDDEE